MAEPTAPSLPRVIPGDGLLHPVPLTAVFVLVLNDHFLKQAYPGALTGKLSDVAGLVFFPLLLQAVLELIGLRRSLVVASGCVVATGLVFAAVQLSADAGSAYRVGLGWAQWLAAQPFRLISGAAPGRPLPVALTQDPTDLLCLPALCLPLVLAKRRAELVD